MRVFCATFALAQIGTVRMKIVLPAAVILLVCLSKSAGAHPLAIVPLPRAGDCTLKFQAPPDTKPSDVRITLDSDTAPLAPAITAGSPMVAKLAQPLAVNSQVTVSVGTAFVTALVQAPPDGASATATVCSADARRVAFDDREVFEASGFLGQVFDNFSPKIDGGYVNDAAATSINSRVTAGIEAQYRLIGKRNDDRQLWLTAHTLHGPRTADANCADIAACEKDQGSAAATFNYVLAHA